jgi:hypothetical protein
MAATHMSKPTKLVGHALEPGDPLARAKGCVCSPERNNNGYGVATEKGRTFYPSNDCPMHGLWR